MGERLAGRHHLDRRDRGVETLVAGLGARALHGLLDAVRRQDTKRYGHAASERRLRDALGDLAGDVIEVRSRSADHGADSHDGVELAGFGEALTNERNLPRAA